MEIVYRARTIGSDNGVINETAVAPRAAREAMELLGLSEVMCGNDVVVFDPIDSTVDLMSRWFAINAGLVEASDG